MGRPKGSKNKLKDNWKPVFLAAMRSYPVVRIACEQAGISRALAYQHRVSDPTFALAWIDAKDDGIDVVEAAMYKRAREKSDLAAIFLLKHQRPAVYADNVNVSVSGSLSIEELHSAKASLHVKFKQIEDAVIPHERKLQLTD